MTAKLSILKTLRIPTADKGYWLKQCELFASHFDSTKVLAVQLGKQDQRGIQAITIVDHAHCVPRQKHFTTSKELLTYIEGFNQAKLYAFNPFSTFTL